MQGMLKQVQHDCYMMRFVNMQFNRIIKTQIEAVIPNSFRDPHALPGDAETSCQ